MDDDFDDRDPIVGFEAPEPKEMMERYSPPMDPVAPSPHDDDDDDDFIGGFGSGRGANIPPPPSHGQQHSGLPPSETASGSPGSLRGLPRHYPGAGARRSHSPNSIVV